MNNLLKLTLIILIALPSVLFGQGGQRLGVNPSHFKLTKNSPSYKASGFCSDGTTRSVDPSTNGKYKWAQSIGNIEVVADGKIYKEGLQSLLQKDIIKIETEGDNNIIFKLNNENSPFNELEIKFSKNVVISDKGGDFNIEPEWIKILAKLKVIPDHKKSFTECAEHIYDFQKSMGIDETGLLDEITRDYLSLCNKLYQSDLLKEFTVDGFRRAKKTYLLNNLKEIAEISSNKSEFSKNLNSYISNKVEGDIETHYQVAAIAESYFEAINDLEFGEKPTDLSIWEKIYDNKIFNDDYLLVRSASYIYFKKIKTTDIIPKIKANTYAVNIDEPNQLIDFVSLLSDNIKVRKIGFYKATEEYENLLGGAKSSNNEKYIVLAVGGGAGYLIFYAICEIEEEKDNGTDKKKLCDELEKILNKE